MHRAMLRYGLQALEEKLARLVDMYTLKRDGHGSHKVILIFTEEPNREIEALDPKNRNVSYLKITNIEVDTQLNPRKQRRTQIEGRLRDGSGYEVIDLVPVIIDLDWNIPLHSGADDYWTLLKTILKIQQGGANFQMRIGIGEDYIPVVGKVTLTSGIPLPLFPGDVQDGEPLSLDISIELSGLFVMLDKPDKEIIPSLASVSITSTNDGTSVVDIVADPQPIA